MRFGGYVLAALVAAFLVSHWASTGRPTWLRTSVSELKASADMPTFGPEGAQKLAENRRRNGQIASGSPMIQSRLRSGAMPRPPLSIMPSRPAVLTSAPLR